MEKNEEGRFIEINMLTVLIIIIIIFSFGFILGATFNVGTEGTIDHKTKNSIPL